MEMFKVENDKLMTEKTTYEALDEELMPVKPIIESNRNLYATKFFGVGSNANSKILPNAASPGYGINSVSKVNGIVGTGRRGGGGFFAHALGETTPKRWSPDLLFRGTAKFFANPDRSYTALSLAVVVTVIIVTILTYLFKRKSNNQRKRTSGRGRKFGRGGELAASSSSPAVGVATRNIRECRLRTGTARAEAPSASLSALQSPPCNFRRSLHTQRSPTKSLCGAYAGTVAPFGVDFRATQVERGRNKVKKTNERKKAKKAASVAKESSSTTPSRGRQTKARNSNTNSNRISPAADKIRRKASVQTPPTKKTASFGKEETKPLGTSRDKPETPPRSTLIEYGSASRPTTHHKYDGFAVKSVSMASEELSYKTPERQLLTMPTRRNSRTPSLEQGPSESSSKGSLMTAMVGRGVTRGSVESSSRSTPSKRGASSVIESARREAQLIIGSAAKARAGPGDYGYNRSTKRANVSTDGGHGNEGPRRSSRYSDIEAVDDSRSRGKTSTKVIERGTTEGGNKGKNDSGAKGGAKRGSTSAEAPARYPKRARKL